MLFFNRVYTETARLLYKYFLCLLQEDDSDPEDEAEEAPEDAGGDDEEEEEEEELIDPGDAVREKCAEHPECTQFKLELETCNNRVNSRSQTEETCVQELFDFLECHDKCVSSM